MPVRLVRRSGLQEARPFSTRKIISSQTNPFSAQWRVFSPHPRASFASFRAFSARAASKEPASTEEAGEKDVVKKRRRKKKTFLEVAQFLPDWGVGARFTKSHWPAGNFYKVMKVKVYKSGRHGAAWGVFHQNESAKTGELQKIGGVNKRCWRYVPEKDLSSIDVEASSRCMPS
ncbi:hypothetical protein GOP47_0006964 [Adiantum capillus-veneris]|uniref:Uncharacterized protein n=1 Tax=Adiantum capillus-veneris TaxID=13818 RepID=A0A9D4ZLF8_ADICA|nr:hypothetical protein GOP47_0006964 [Adiantum capillus-veneris]